MTLIKKKQRVDVTTQLLMKLYVLQGSVAI